ncbi:MLP-like protein 423 [Primulina eburnea]|uniref:MLP-like protein 423 n=1 Tax=Primulina eburnea TaxID=1245227 RepID=UPI003C6C753E
MTSPQHLEVDLELKCHIEKVWDCMKNATTVLPEAFPHKFDSFEVLEGDGVHAGTVYNVKFKPGHPISSSKDKVELVDEEKKIYVKRIVDGDFMEFFKEFKITIVLSPKGENGTSLKWGCEFVKASEDVPIKPENIMADAVNTIQVLEAFILSKA